VNTPQPTARRDAPRDARTDTREALIEVGTGLIGRAGFQATGLDAILKAARVPKGSFYHYFASKEEFGLAVIEQFARGQDARLAEALGDRSVPPLVRVARFMDDRIGLLNQHACSSGCLMGELGQEMAAQNEAFRLRIDRAMQAWRRHFAACFEEARLAGQLPVESDPERLADLLQIGWQGALLRAKIARAPAPMVAFRDAFFSDVLKVPRPTE